MSYNSLHQHTTIKYHKDKAYDCVKKSHVSIFIMMILLNLLSCIHCTTTNSPSLKPTMVYTSVPSVTLVNTSSPTSLSYSPEFHIISNYDNVNGSSVCMKKMCPTLRAAMQHCS
jgi:hypothetical protein